MLPKRKKGGQSSKSLYLFHLADTFHPNSTNASYRSQVLFSSNLTLVEERLNTATQGNNWKTKQNGANWTKAPQLTQLTRDQTLQTSPPEAKRMYDPPMI